MRYLLLFVLSVAGFLSGCSPDHPADPNTPPENQIPAEEKITTQVAGFATTSDNTFFNNTLVYAGNLNWNLSTGNFLTDKFNSDKYLTRITLNDPMGVEKRKTITLTPAAINYVRLKPMKMASLGQFKNSQGGTFTYAGTGSIMFPANSIYQPGTPGFYGPDVEGNVTIGYLDPLSSDFGVSIPCYSFADDNNKRVFLASLGVVAVSAGYLNPVWETTTVDLYSNHAATLKVPIPANLPSAAPDSIPLWRLNEGRWTRVGTAQKTGNTYTAIISKLGTYNLALPVKGVYKTIRLRTSINTPIINATVRIKYNQAVIAESQTDSDGNTFVFLPADQNLGVELYQVWWNSQTAHTASISTSTSDQNLDITVNNTLNRVYEFKGNANNCDGTPVANGKVTIYSPLQGLNLHFPVINGTYNGAILNDPGPGYPFTAKLLNVTNNISGADTGVIAQAGAVNIYNLNTCPLPPNLYMNYTIDGVPYTITGNLSTPMNPILIAWQTSGTTMVVAGQTPTVLQFRTNAFKEGVYTGSGIDALYVNNGYYVYDPGKPMRVTFSRYDLLVGGLIFGSADFYYKDAAGISRHVIADFRVKRTQ